MRRLLLSVVIPYFLSLGLIPPIAAQDSNNSSTPQQGADVGPNGVYRIGGDVSAPVLIRSVEPDYPEKALHARVTGAVLVNLYVDVNGNPTHVHVIRGIGQRGTGLGFDESADNAVRQYKFKPALKNGKPVRVELNVEVYFQVP
jgi:periplasmic protein TonB